MERSTNKNTTAHLKSGNATIEYADRCRSLLHMLILAIALLCNLAGTAQTQRTSVRGRVIDATTSEPLPFVQVFFQGTQISAGTMSDANGWFSITSTSTDTLLTFRMIGYQTHQMAVAYGANLRNIKIPLVPTQTELKTVTIKAKGRKERYRRKDNPAVELARQVIEHKDSNNIEAINAFSRTTYDKSIMALDDFHPNFRKHLLWRQVPFVERYIDTTRYDNTEILHFSVSESLGQEQNSLSPRLLRSLITAHREDGFAQEITPDEQKPQLVSDLFTPVNIYQNDIPLMSNTFVSPLSSVAIGFYHYYITDTVVFDGKRYTELSFTPAVKGTYGFTGQMYVSTDSLYSVRIVSLKVPPIANLLFIRDLTALQTFTIDSTGRYLPQECVTYGRLGLSKRIKKVYIQRSRHYSDYRFNHEALTLPDSLFDALTTSVTLPTADTMRRAQWNSLRPVPLTFPETMVDSLRYEMMDIPFMRGLIWTVNVLGTGYFPTASPRDSSKVMLGSIWNLWSYNSLEGNRLRFGYYTRYPLSHSNFSNGYLAYGLGDRRFKYKFTFLHTFEPKRRNAYESPLGLIDFTTRYEVETPGVAEFFFDPDNILMSGLTTTLKQYVFSNSITLQKQWKQSLRLNAHLSSKHHEPANDLSYQRIAANGSLEFVDGYWSHEVGATLSLQSHSKTNSQGNEASLNLSPSRYSLSLSHTTGFTDGFFYNKTSFSFYRRQSLSFFGALEVNLSGGKVWNQAPLPLLFIPHGSAIAFSMDNAFNTMRPMQYIVDQHLSLFATYHARGLILNHIPIIRRLKLHEVAGFNLFYGSLSAKNDPDLGHTGLYLIPSATQRLGTLPYMEYSIGIENILGILRLDYVHRITYLDGTHMDAGIRLGFSFSL